VRQVNLENPYKGSTVPFISPNLELLLPWFEVDDKDKPFSERGTRGEDDYQLQVINPITGDMGPWFTRCSVKV